MGCCGRRWKEILDGPERMAAKDGSREQRPADRSRRLEIWVWLVTAVLFLGAFYLGVTRALQGEWRGSGRAGVSHPWHSGG